MATDKRTPVIGRVSQFYALIRQDKMALAGLIIFSGIFVAGLVGDLVIPWTVVTNVNFAVKLLPPSQAHWFGTDDYGRDLFSLCILAATTDILYSLGIVICAVAIGTVLGAISGLLQRADSPIQTVTDIFLAMPGLILAMGFAAVAGHSIALLALAIALAWWPVYSRLVRGQILIERKKLYVTALQALGIPRTRVLFRHVLPNTFGPVLARATTDVGWTILALSSLDFIGFGPGPYVPEWGSLISAGLGYIFQDPWLIIIPGIFILLTSLSLNFLGDWLRDLYDIRSRRREI